MVLFEDLKDVTMEEQPMAMDVVALVQLKPLIAVQENLQYVQ